MAEGEVERGRGTVGRGGEGRGSWKVGIPACMAGIAGTGGGLVASWRDLSSSPAVLGSMAPEEPMLLRERRRSMGLVRCRRGL